MHDEHGHNEDTHEGGLLNTIIEITFGIEHMAAEFFWNAVFLLVGFAVSKAIALRKIHKYIDEKHGVTHKEGY
jgi:phage tail tube protein FII